jgi:thiamine monophosphate synthase
MVVVVAEGMDGVGVGSFGVDGSVSEAATIVGEPRAVGTSVTSLRTLPTAAAATMTATSVAAIQAAPIPIVLLMPPFWGSFGGSGLTQG